MLIRDVIARTRRATQAQTVGGDRSQCAVLFAEVVQPRPYFPRMRASVRCQDCGLVYSLPRPTEMSLSELYDDIGEKYFTDPRMLSFYFGPHRFERELRFIGRYMHPGSSLMDVGCCVGAFVHAAAEQGYLATGIDISHAAVKCGAERGLKVRVENMLATNTTTPSTDYACGAR